MIYVMMMRELARAGRGHLTHYARWAYSGWLLLVLYFMHAAYYTDYLVTSPKGQFPASGTADFAHRLVDFLVFQQVMVVLLAGPTFAAGAITDEKVRGTLQLLFLAQLSPWDIIVGKLLARVVQGFLWSLAAWPVIAFAGFAGGVTPIFFVCLVIITFVMLAGSTAASLLISVWCRTTRDAVIAIYVLMAIMFAVVNWAHTAGRAWEWLAAFDPNYVLDAARDAPDYLVLRHRLALSLIVWIGMSIFSTAIAAWRLRPVFIKQQTNRRRRIVTALALRPAMTDRPIAWKEQYSLRVPRALAVLITGLCATVVATALVATSIATFMLIDRLFYGFISVGMLASVIAGIRGSGAIVNERDRQTWDCLACTPYDFSKIVDDKIAGICQSIWPYFFAIIIPTAAVLSLANLDQLVAALPATQRNMGIADTFMTYGPKLLLFIIGPSLLFFGSIGVALLLNKFIHLPWYPFCACAIACAAGANLGAMVIAIPFGVAITAAAMQFMAGVGLWMSARSRSAWLSLLGTMAVGQVAAVVTISASCPFCCITGLLFLLLGSGVKELFGVDTQQFLDTLWPAFFGVGGTFGLWWVGQLFAQWAAQHLERTDRVAGNYVRNIDFDEPYGPGSNVKPRLRGFP